MRAAVPKARVMADRIVVIEAVRLNCAYAWLGQSIEGGLWLSLITARAKSTSTLLNGRLRSLTQTPQGARCKCAIAQKSKRLEVGG